MAAQPPRAVSRSSAGSFLPTVYMASIISSSGMNWGIPASDISAAIRHWKHQLHYGSGRDIPPAAYRVTYKTEHIHKNGGSRIGTLQRSAAKKLNSSGSSHCRSDSDLSLTSANSTGNCCITHGKIADRAALNSAWRIFYRKSRRPLEEQASFRERSRHCRQ